MTEGTRPPPPPPAPTPREPAADPPTQPEPQVPPVWLRAGSPATLPERVAAEEPGGGTLRPSLGMLLLGAVVGAVVGAIVTAGIFLVFDDDPEPTAAPAVPTGQPNLELNVEAMDIQGVLAKAQPSVVSIETNQTALGGVFGSAGSGVIISEDGLVLTNAHVISGADSIEVLVVNGETHAADLVGSFPEDDIALIQLEGAGGLVPAELGSSADLQVGDEVLAIGNALNLGGQPSVTQGIVSAKDRTIDAPGVGLTNLIQTDAPINPGNSGGPLVNALGQMVGLNTAIIEGAENIGFAIVIDPIKPLIERLRTGEGDVTPDTAFLGVSTTAVAELTPELAEEFGVEVESGAFVAEVVANSAAESLGLEPGDVIVAIDGESVESSDDVARIVRGHDPGDDVEVEWVRGDDEESATATLGSRADPGG